MKRELPFLLIDDRYGGDQQRFAHPMMRRGGCSTVCACHAAACLAAKDPDRRALCPFPGLQVSEALFERFAEDMFVYVHPGFRGMPKTSLFEAAFSRYAASRGAPVCFDDLQGDAPYEAAARFVREHIDAGLTIQFLLLKHRHPEFADMEWHWFTLTGYEERNDGGMTVVYADEGRRFTADLARLWDTGQCERGGMLVVR
jgi:hypothetical protein